MSLLSFSQYAKHRGVSKEAVSKAVKAKRIGVVVDDNGRRWIDPAVADQEWEKNTANNRGKGTAGPVLDGEPNYTKSESKTVSYAENRAIREAYNARIAKLTYEQMAGKLVDANEVKVQTFSMARAIREALFTIPDRLAPELAGETDTDRIYAMLTQEIRNALEALGNAG